MIRVVLPFHLRNLARIGDEALLEIAAPVTGRWWMRWWKNFPHVDELRNWESCNLREIESQQAPATRDWRPV